MKPPKSVVSIPINLAGLACFLLVLNFYVSHQISTDWSTATMVVVLLLALAIPIIILESIFLRPPLLSLSPPNNKRVAIKLLALYAVWGVIAFIYWVFPEYRGDFYQPFWDLLYPALPWLFCLSIPYFWIVDQRMKQPEDAYFALGSWLLKRQPFDKPLISQLFLGWLIKLFFLPLMIIYFGGNIHALIKHHHSWALITQDFQHIYDFFYLLLFTIDLVIAAVGYILTLRLLDTHMRSAEPTMTGWFAALICYQPFLGGVSALFLAYNLDKYTWGQWLGENDVAYVLWGSVILLSLFIYAFSSVMFGIRFSNLSHRGIITNGFYRYSKHPAYLSKNLSWWMITIPFISQTNNIEEVVRASAMLLLVNFIYYVRAKTEERHLMRDPVYRAYAEWVDNHGSIAKLKQYIKIS